MRVLLIDDHTLFRSGLSELLERRGVEVLGAVGNAQDGVQMTHELNPDVVLLDLRMPEMGGLAALDQLSDISIPIVVLTTSTEEQDLVSALKLGAKGYLLKNIEPNLLIEALENVLSGKTVVTPELTDTLARAVQRESSDESSDDDRFSGLTPREMEILCHLAEGLSNKVIASRLGISDGTVKLHVRAVLKKLEVRSRVEAAVLAVEQNVRERFRAR